MSKFKEVKFKSDALEGIVKGINIVADATKVTLGPNGKNVIIEQKNASPIVTKDGVTVVRNITLRDDLQNLGATIIKDVASRTVFEAGDGTTTATILTQAIANASLKAKYSSLSSFKRGMDDCVKKAIEIVKTESKPISTVEELINVATISANNDKEIGTMVGKMIHEIGKDGSVTFEQSQTSECSYKIIDGLSFGEGFMSSYFVNSQDKGACIFDNPQILITNQKIDSIQPLTTLLDYFVKKQLPLVIIAEDFSREFVGLCVANKNKGVLKICLIRAPKFVWSKRQSLEDLALVCGTVVCSSENNKSIDNIMIQELGNCKKIEVKRNSTTIVGGNTNEEAFNLAITSIDSEIEENKNNFEVKQRLLQRKNKLLAKVAMMYVGGDSSSEIGHTKDRIDDSIAATKASYEDGIVIGSANMLLKIYKELDTYRSEDEDWMSGFEIVRTSLLEPFNVLIKNSDLNGDIVGETVTKNSFNKNFGFDFATNKIVDMMLAGIIDPAKVLISCIKNSVSTASMLLSSEVVILEPEDEFDVFKPKTQQEVE